MCYLHVQDFVDVYVGPFPSMLAAKEHYDWTKEVGDGAAMMSISDELPPSGEMVITPEADKAYLRKFDSTGNRIG